MARSQWLAIVGAVVFAVLLFIAPKKSAEQKKQLEGNEAKIMQAIALVHDGKEPMKGIAMLREVLQEEPENVKALFHLGVFCVQSGQYDKARERFESVLKVEPGHIDSRFYLGHVYANLGLKEEAREQFEKLIAETDDKEVIREAEKYLNELNSI